MTTCRLACLPVFPQLTRARCVLWTWLAPIGFATFRYAGLFRDTFAFVTGRGWPVGTTLCRPVTSCTTVTRSGLTFTTVGVVASLGTRFGMLVVTSRGTLVVTMLLIGVFRACRVSSRVIVLRGLPGPPPVAASGSFAARPGLVAALCPPSLVTPTFLLSEPA